MQAVAGLLGGVIFGFGLVLSGMTDPSKVLAFLTLNAHWDPALIFVMGSAVAVGVVGFYLVGRRSSPLWDTQFQAPARFGIDSRLLGGASLFGLGWGISGFCPGPAIVGFFTLDLRALIFLLAFVVGLEIFERLLAPAPQLADG